MDLSKDVLTVNYAYLVDHVKADDVVPRLVSARLVGRQICQEIENQTDAKKVQTLLNEIYRSPDPEWFVKFTTALSDTDANHEVIAEKLQAEYENRKQPKSVTTSVSRSWTESVVSTGSSAVKQPVPSLSAPPPAIGAGGTTSHHDQSSTRSQEMNGQQQMTVQSPAQPPKVAPQGRKTLRQCDQGNIDDITDVSFAILVANENEYKAVLNYFGMGFTMVTQDQPYTNAVLDCTFDSDSILAQNGTGEQKPAAGLTQCSDDYHSITINGKTGIIYQTASIGSGGRQGAMITTVQLLKVAKERRWPLEIIFVVGCTGGHGKDAENGQVIVPTKVIEYNRGKIVMGDDRQPKQIRQPEIWQTSEKWCKSVKQISNRDGGENGRGITMAEVDYDYSGDFVVKAKTTAEKLRTTVSGQDTIGIEMEGVGVATAIHVAETLGFGIGPEFLIVKGISDNADGNKGATAPMLFFGKKYDAVYPDDRQVMAALQSVTLAARAIHKRMEWKYRAATDRSYWCSLM